MTLDCGAPDVSVIVPTWNNSERLAVTLAAVARAIVPDGPSWELVLVDNDGSERTRTVAEQFRQRLPLVYLHEPRLGVSNARNAGVAAARGALLVFNDDDVRPAPGLIARYWSAYRDRGDRTFLGGPLLSEFECPPDEELRRIAFSPITGRDYGPVARPLAPGEYFPEANWACPATALRAAGGFDPNLGHRGARRKVGEGAALVERLEPLGVTGYYLPDAIVHHHVPRHRSTARYMHGYMKLNGIASFERGRPWRMIPKFPVLVSLFGPERNPSLAACLVAIVRLAARWLRARMAGLKGHEAYVALGYCLGFAGAHLTASLKSLVRRANGVR